MTSIDCCCWLMLLGSLLLSWLTSLSISCCVLLCYCLVLVLFGIACGAGLFFPVLAHFLLVLLLVGALLVGTLRFVTLLAAALGCGCCLGSLQFLDLVRAILCCWEDEAIILLQPKFSQRGQNEG